MSIGSARSLPAQVDDSTVLAVARTITATELTHHFAALATAADSVRNLSDTAQRARAWREWAAAYIAEQWRQLGLVPTLPQPPVREIGVMPDPSVWVPRYPELGPWVQRYPAPGQRQLNYARTRLVLQTSGTDGRASIQNEAGYKISLSPTVELAFGSSAYFLPEAGPPLLRESFARTYLTPPSMLGGPRVLLVAGPHTTATLHSQRAEFENAVVIYVPPAGLDAATRRGILTELYTASRGVIVLDEADSAAFARELQAARQVSVTAVDHYMLETIAAQRTWPWVAAARLVDVPSTRHPRFWSRVGIEPADLHALTTPVVRELPGAKAWLYVALEPQKPPTQAVPSAPVSAPMAGEVDSESAPSMLPYVLGFLEGTDSALKQQIVVITASLGDGADNGAELAGLVTLAWAFTRPGARPRRSVLFVAAGGGPPVYSGSWMIANQLVSQAVAALTLEPRGVSLPVNDTLLVDGGPDVVLPQAPAWVAAAHPELGLHVVDTGTVFRAGTAALPFAAHWVPSLRMQLGALGPAPPADTAAAVRELQFVWYLGATLADALKAPQWTAAGRQRYFETLGPSQP